MPFVLSVTYLARVGIRAGRKRRVLLLVKDDRVRNNVTLYIVSEQTMQKTYRRDRRVSRRRQIEASTRPSRTLPGFLACRGLPRGSLSALAAF